MNILNRPAIKMEARSFIGQQTLWFKMFLATVIVYIISNSVSISFNIYEKINYGFGSFFVNNFDRGTDVTSIRGTCSMVIGLLVMPFMVSIAGYYLNHIRGFNPDAGSLYKEAIDNYGKYFIVQFVTGFMVFLWSLLLVVPGIIKAIAYSQVQYIIHDNKNLSASDAREMSDIMTKGYKADLFILGLSFIPWYLLMAITFGIAGIYVLPYTNTVGAMYYENLKKNAIDNNLIAPEAFGLVVDTYNNADSNFTSYGNGADNQNLAYQPFTRNPESTFNPDLVGDTQPVNTEYKKAEFVIDESVKQPENTQDNVPSDKAEGSATLNEDEINKED